MNLKPIIRQLLMTLCLLIALVGIVEISKSKGTSTLGAAITNQVNQLTKD